MFASDIRSTIQVGNVEVVVKKLSKRSLDKAREAKSIATALQLKAFGGDLLKALREDTVAEAVESLRAKQNGPEARKAAFLATFDFEHVLNAGIVSWNAARKLDPAAIADLDEDSASTIFHAILDLSIPPSEAVEADEGNA